MYLLLAGFTPFCGHTREEIIEAALKGEVQFSHPNWKKVSADAKKLITLLLNYDSEKRITADQALHHPWVLKYGVQEDVSATELKSVYNNLKNSNAQLVFQRAVLSYLASQQMQYKEEDNIRRMFSFLDCDKDGQLSKQDLIQGFSKVVKDQARLRKEIEQIVKNIDMDHNMQIDYNEFLVANLNIDSALTPENLKQAFEFFDEVWFSL